MLNLKATDGASADGDSATTCPHNPQPGISVPLPSDDMADGRLVDRPDMPDQALGLGETHAECLNLVFWITAPYAARNGSAGRWLAGPAHTFPTTHSPPWSAPHFART